VPVLNEILRDPDARALYLFPTKALSQDQQAELNATLTEGELDVAVMTFDGDTPVAIRGNARTRGQIIISNPDMLHAGILPNHTKWVQFFQNLRYVVIDELHTYRGIFGSHVCNVIRRLRRVAAFYGSDPRFIMCSATIGNPGELAAAMIEAPVSVVDRNGAPTGEKHVILYNPPLVDRVQGIRQGIVHASRTLALRFLRRGVKTIVFARPDSEPSSSPDTSGRASRMSIPRMNGFASSPIGEATCRRSGAPLNGVCGRGRSTAS
jgi:DEAD/DEAH box helicase domain-containing protein